MKYLSLISYWLLFCLSIQSVSSQNIPTNGNAILPPRGWNSYDSFSWVISEEEYLQNAHLISQSLLVHGYEYAVVDYLWHRSLEGSEDSTGFDTIDEWGRMLPHPQRWPSSKAGKGFGEVANKVHSMGLKFGIHLMAGISTQAFNQNTPILDTTKGVAYEENGRKWHAQDIGIKEKACSWLPHSFMAINTTLGAGRAFLRSIYELYASWGVDFVKLDCVFGDNLDLNEIISVSEILKELDRPIVFSVSPGVSATPDMAKKVSGLVNMYRVTGDDWDKWQHLLPHFNISRDFAVAKLLGVDGLRGKSWPDLDMLPLGWLTNAGVKEGPHRFSNLTKIEQRTQMTLWSMAKSPLMYGGDLRKLDTWTYNLITNPTLLEINSFSSNNMEFPYTKSVTSSRNKEQLGIHAAEESTVGIRSWIATGRKGEVYVAFFNLNDENTKISVKTSNLSTLLPGTRMINCQGKDLWNEKNKSINGTLLANVRAHGCALFVLYCT